MSNNASLLFIVILRYKAPLAQIDAIRSAHVDFLSHHYTTGSFISSGPQAPRQGGVIIAQCSSQEALQAILKQDPFAINDLADYEIIAFSPTMITPYELPEFFLTNKVPNQKNSITKNDSNDL